LGDFADDFRARRIGKARQLLEVLRQQMSGR
jgi:hypothetical protein